MRVRTPRVAQTRLVTLRLAFLFTLIIASGVSVAAEQQTKAASSSKKVATAKTTHSPGASRARAQTAGSAVLAVSEDIALATFDAFTIEWMKKLEQTEEFHKAQAQITPASDGFAVEYVGYLPHRYIRIKKTESTDTPYVGILTYFEKKLRCTAKTKEAVLQGPFEQVETNQVSEIFRFTKGKWVY